MFFLRRWLPWIALLGVMLLAVYLRLANVAVNPAWYTDEGTHLDIARHLVAGRIQYLAINQSWLLFSRLPLFELLLGGVMLIGGVSMLTLRSLTALLGVITVLVLFAVTWRMTRMWWLAWLAALLLAIYPPAVIYSRFGFSYNLLSPLVLLVVLGTWKFTGERPSTVQGSAQDARRRWLALAAVSIGLATLTEIWAFMLLVPFTLIVVWRDALSGTAALRMNSQADKGSRLEADLIDQPPISNRRRWRHLNIWWSLPLALLPFTFYVAIMMLTVPRAFTFDLAFVLSRLNQLPLDRQIATLWQNVTTVTAQDGWLVLAVIGLALLTAQAKHAGVVTLAFWLLPFVLLGRTTPLFNLSAYYLIPLFPLMALGVANVVRPRRDRPVTYVIAALFTALMLSSTMSLIAQTRDGFHTDIDPFLLNPSDAARVAEYINANADSDDVVIASPGVAWMISARAADMQMPIAYRGTATPHLPADLPLDRWAFNPDYRAARFMVIDNLWCNWAVPNIPGVAEMLQKVETWPLAFTAGEIAVYQNPVR